MKVLYIGMARAIWLFDFRLANPNGAVLRPVIEALTARYAFAKSPKNELDITENALAFKSGRFVNPQGVSVLVSLSIYNDGLLAETVSSTDDSTAFLIEVSEWTRREFGLVIPPEVRIAYVSQVVFESDAHLIALSPSLGRFLQLLQERYKSIDGRPRNFEFTGLSFWTEEIGKPLAPGAFKIERKISAPFASRMYFSEAPFETRAHIELLGELEGMLKGQ